MRKPTLKTCRRTFQIFIALAFIFIPVLNRSRYSFVYGNFLSFQAFGVPFADPLAVLQLTVKNWYFTLDTFIGALLPLILAFTLGTVFCSWICPYGLLPEWAQKVNRKFVARSPREGMSGRKGFPYKIVIFSLGFSVFFLFSTTPILNQLSTAAWYSRFFQYYFGQDVVSLCGLFLISLLCFECVLGKRFWCRYICPQSVLLVLVKLLNRKRLKVVFAKQDCICNSGYERCKMACTLGLNPKTEDNVLETECNNCGDCVVSCQKMGKALSFELPFAGIPFPHLKIQVSVLFKFLVVAVFSGILFFGIVRWIFHRKLKRMATRFSLRRELFSRVND